MAEGRKPKRVFSPEQKADIVRAIQNDIKNGMGVGEAVRKADIQSSMYAKWKRQLEVGIHSSLRNGKAPIDREKRALEKRISSLESIVLEQAAIIASLKKETNWGL